jgi:hypothetical protein
MIYKHIHRWTIEVLYTLLKFMQQVTAQYRDSYIHLSYNKKDCKDTV